MHLTNWAQILGDRYGFVTGKSSLQPSPVNASLSMQVLLSSADTVQKQPDCRWCMRQQNSLWK